MVSNIHHMTSLRWKLTLADKDKEQQDTFFIAHQAFTTPAYVLGMLIRRFDEALMHPEERCYDIQLEAR